MRSPVLGFIALLGPDKTDSDRVNYFWSVLVNRNLKCRLCVLRNVPVFKTQL